MSKTGIKPLTSQVLRNIAVTLERWAEESESGGWSTHQVKSQRELAKRIYDTLGADDLSRFLERQS